MTARRPARTIRLTQRQLQARRDTMGLAISLGLVVVMLFTAVVAGITGYQADFGRAPQDVALTCYLISMAMTLGAAIVVYAEVGPRR